MRSLLQNVVVGVLLYLALTSRTAAGPASESGAVRGPQFCREVQLLLDVPLTGQLALPVLGKLVGRTDENGKMQPPTPEELQELAEALVGGIEPDLLSNTFWKSFSLEGPTETMLQTKRIVGGTSDIGLLMAAMFDQAFAETNENPAVAQTLCRGALVLGAQHRTTVPTIFMARIARVEAFTKQVEGCIRLEQRKLASLKTKIDELYGKMEGDFFPLVKKAMVQISELASVPTENALDEAAVNSICANIEQAWLLSNERPDLRTRLVKAIYYLNSLAAVHQDAKTTEAVGVLTGKLMKESVFPIERVWLDEAAERTDWTPVPLDYGPDGGKPAPPN